MRISDWSSDVCSSDLCGIADATVVAANASGGCGHGRRFVGVRQYRKQRQLVIDAVAQHRDRRAGVHAAYAPRMIAVGMQPANLLAPDALAAGHRQRAVEGDERKSVE